MNTSRHSGGCYTCRVMTRQTNRLASLFVLMSCALLFAVPIDYHPVLFTFAALVGHAGLVQSSRLRPMEPPGTNALATAG